MLEICKCIKPTYHKYYSDDVCKTCGGRIEKKKENTKTDNKGKTLGTLQEDNQGEG